MSVEAVQQQVTAYQGSAQGETTKGNHVITMLGKVQEDSKKTDKEKKAGSQVTANQTQNKKSRYVEQENKISESEGLSETEEKSAAEILQDQQEQIEQDNERIRKAVETFNKKSNGNTALKFGIHDKTNRIMIKIVDKDTQKVIREYPPEETLDMISKVLELAGMVVDEKR